MKRNILLFGVIAVIFAAAGMYFGARHHTPAAAESASAANFFAQQLPDPGGRMHLLSQWQGKPLIINFWATWCAPCVEEMPELAALQAELAPKNMHIIGIGIDTPANIQAFAAKYHISYPLYVAGISGTELSRQFGNQSGGLPFTVLIDAKGKIEKTYLGRLQMDQLRADLHAL
jgi:thiol-disulfide isomerase/thioredoxin